ncbi:MAG: Uma2 family endonuclease [Polyangiaceae bacterium]|nr:Uma2 family endonuclease [Polyangiaceae bacterium]
MAGAPYEVDLNDPRAPDLETWGRLTPRERQRVIDQLPSEFELAPPEGDVHRVPKHQALDALDAYFRKAGRRVYLSSELPVYYPGAPVIAPDLLAVMDVEVHERQRWVVAAEGKGLDFALEVTVEGSRKKDLEINVAKFAALGIAEYFVFDRKNHRLYGWRLPPGGTAYSPLIPQQGRWRSLILGLDLGLEGDRLRFYAGTAVVPNTEELLARANFLAEDLQSKLLVAELRAEQEAERAEDEKRRAEDAEARIAQLEAELERLKH